VNCGGDDVSSQSHGAPKVLRVYVRKTKREKGELASERGNV